MCARLTRQTVRSFRARAWPWIVGALLVQIIPPGAAHAQVAGCTVEALGIVGGERLRCRDGLVIEAEAGASYRLIDRDRDNRPEGIELRAKALFVDRPSGARGGFQIRTPHAIASVRGTVWTVDVAPRTSSVFVVQGRVRVARTSGRASVVLDPGEGVDVDASPGPLEVKRWPPPRVRALLARFGR